MVTRSNGEIARGAVGLRRLDRNNQIDLADRFHIGSVTKSFTATVIGVLVSRGVVDWDTTIEQTFPDWKFRPEYASVTVAELLSHESGIPPFTEDDEVKGVPEDRQAFARYALTLEPIGPRGQFAYSNGGYVVVAAMAEKLSGRSWETLLRDEIFRPLRLSTASIGWPARRGLAQPWGHVEDGGKVVPHDPDGSYQISAAMAPAGDLHMSVSDLGKFLRSQLIPLRGGRGILPHDIATTMHTRRLRSGLGFGVTKIGDVAPVSTYSGSAGTFVAMIAIAPKHDTAVAVVTNEGTEKAEAAVRTVLKELLARYASQTE